MAQKLFIVNNLKEQGVATPALSYKKRMPDWQY